MGTVASRHQKHSLLQFSCRRLLADVNHDGNQDVVVFSVPNLPNGDQPYVSAVTFSRGDGRGNFGNAIVTTLDEFATGFRWAIYQHAGRRYYLTF
jgi:hypothetical protein